MAEQNVDNANNHGHAPVPEATNPHTVAGQAVHESVGGKALDEHAAHGAEEHHHAADAHEGDHGHGHGDHGPALGRHLSHPPEPPNALQVWYQMEQKQLIKEYMEQHPDADAPSVYEPWMEERDGHFVMKEGESPSLATTLHIGTLEHPLPLIGYAPWQPHVFFGIGLLFVLGLGVVLSANVRADRRRALRKPTRLQVVGEMIVGAFDDFTQGVLGKENGRLYLPFIATLFSVILICNLMGLVPLFFAPTASIVITFSLALCTFIVVQSTAWIRLGPLTYIHHLMGSPKDLVGWILSPLFLVLECISDFGAKPLSLALRLMGNILGKDILLGAFLGMGISLMGILSTDLSSVIGVPLTAPFYLLGLLLSTIQALVFSLLTMIYITMVLPHDHDHDHDEAHGHEHHADEADYRLEGSPDNAHGHGEHHPKRVVHEAIPQ